MLIVDDESDARELTAVILATAGARVDEAASGEEALAKLSRTRFDIIVSDIAMPHMDGIRLLHVLREQVVPSSEMPALAFTAFASSSDRDEALSAGFDRHLGKTADASTLVSVVAELASRRVEAAS